MSADAGEPKIQGKLDYIIASSSSLKRRLERSQRPEQVQQMMQEVKKLSADLQPMLTLINEFKAKWEAQKRSLLQQKRLEIDAFLRNQDEQALGNFTKTAEAELAEANAKSRTSALVAKELEDLLGKAVEEWRAEAHGAGLVKPSDVEKATRMMMQRVHAWSCQQEDQLLTTWKEMLRRLLTELLRLDFSNFQTLDGKLFARRQIVDDMLQRQRQQLAQATKQMQDTLTQRSLEMLVPDREEQRKRDKKAERRLMLNEARLASQQRAEAAKNEAVKALKAQLNDVLFALDRRAAKLLLKRSVLQEAMATQEGPLVSALEEELQRRLEHLKRHSVRRVSADTALAAGELSHARSEEDETDAQVQLEVARRRSRVTSELSQLRSELKTMLASLAQGNLGLKPWPEVLAKERMEQLQDTKAALAIQEQILQKSKGDEQALKEVITGLAKNAKDFQEELGPKFEAVASAKRRLWQKRHGFLTAAAKGEQRRLAEVEAEVLRHVAKLVPEAEAMAELGRALQRQATATSATSATFPVVLVCGSWRRVVQDALPLLLRLWELAGTDEGEQRHFLAQMLATKCHE